MKPILHTLNSQGSGSGFSYYSRWSDGCNKKAALDTAAAKQYSATSYTGMVALDLGTILHAFLELHYKRGLKGIFDVSAVQFSDVVQPDHESRVEAENIFRSYRQNHDPTELGEVLEVEEAYPKNKIQAKAINEAVGIAPYTFKLDLATYIDAKVKKTLERTHELVLPKPGKYMIDHKSEGSWDTSAQDRHLNKLSFTAYMLAYNAANPKDPILGMIDNILLKTKGYPVKRLFVPLPDSNQVKSLMAHWKIVNYNMTHMYDWANPKDLNCFPRGKICFWHKQGMCERY